MSSFNANALFNTYNNRCLKKKKRFPTRLLNSAFRPDSCFLVNTTPALLHLMIFLINMTTLSDGFFFWHRDLRPLMIFPT